MTKQATPVPEAMDDAKLVEAMARTLARRASGLKMRHEKNAWADTHWADFIDDVKALLDVARHHLTPAPDPRRSVAEIEAEIAAQRADAKKVEGLSGHGDIYGRINALQWTLSAKEPGK